AARRAAVVALLGLRVDDAVAAAPRGAVGPAGGVRGIGIGRSGVTLLDAGANEAVAAGGRHAGVQAGVVVARVPVVALLARVRRTVAAARARLLVHADVVRLVAAVGGARVGVAAVARG